MNAPAPLMQAAVIHAPGVVRLDTVQRPQPGPGDVVVKIAACGICGSDLTYAKLGGLNGPAGPMPLGHELSATVAAIGSAVQGFSIGQRVIVNPYANLIGNGGSEGAFANYLLVREVSSTNSLLPIPDALSMEHAALAEPLAVALHGVNRAQARPGQKIAVFGAGPIGLGVVVGLRRRGVEDIVSIDYSPLRLERARQLGARATINPAETDVRAALGELHGTQRHFIGMEVVNTDTFIDVAGAPPVIPGIIDMCRLGAHLVVTAVYSAPIAIDFRMMLAKELSIAMAIGYPDEFGEIVEMLADGQTDVEPMISHRYAFTDFHQAFETAKDARTSAKVMVTFP